MMYQIAGLRVGVTGDVRMPSCTVRYRANPAQLRFERTESPANGYDAASGEGTFPDAASAFQDVSSAELTNLLKRSQGLENRAGGCAANEKGESLYVLRRMADYEAGEENCPADFEILYRAVPRIERPSGEAVGTVRGFSCVRTAEGYSLLNGIDLLADYTVRMDIRADFRRAEIFIYDVENLGGLDLATRLHSYIGEVFAYLALQKGRLVFHAAAVALNGAGVCFSAPSGTGKSTHADLWAKYFKAVRVNDDTPVLYAENGKIWVCGTPWSGKTAQNINIKVPLSGIVCLQQKPKNSIEHLRGAAALRCVLAESKLAEIPPLFHAGMQTAGSVLEQVPVYRLGCNISREAAELAREALCI